jgi:hypothetical protein
MTRSSSITAFLEMQSLGPTSDILKQISSMIHIYLGVADRKAEGLDQFVIEEVTAWEQAVTIKEH